MVSKENVLQCRLRGFLHKTLRCLKLNPTFHRLLLQIYLINRFYFIALLKQGIYYAIYALFLLIMIYSLIHSCAFIK